MKISNDALFRGHGSDLHAGVMVDFASCHHAHRHRTERDRVRRRTKTGENQLVTVLSVDHITW